MPYKNPEDQRAYFQAYDKARAVQHNADSKRRRKLRPPEYDVWAAMKKRCCTPSSDSYVDYGARGITVCARWRKSFDAFLADIGPRPSPRHSLERKRNGEGYHPDNCKWATASEQQRNTRANHILRLDGRAQCVTAWAEEFGLNSRVVFQRLDYGWPPIAALTTPVRGYHGQATG
jgi:hypothetical protein